MGVLQTCLNSCLWAPTLKLAQHQLALCWHQWSASALQLGGYLDLQVAERWVGAWRVSRIKTFWSRRRTHAGESEQGGKRAGPVILSFAGSRIPKDLGDPSTQEFPQNRVAPLENFPLESPRSHRHFSIMAVLMLQTAQDWRLFHFKFCVSSVDPSLLSCFYTYIWYFIMPKGHILLSCSLDTNISNIALL